MKQIRNLLSFVMLALLAVSCVKDDTSLGDGAISVMEIDSTSIQTEYNIKKNDVLVIEPKIVVNREHLSSKETRSTAPYELTWEVELKTVATGPQFRYEATQLGTYRCRLIAENADGKTFFNFTINVNTPYEEGLTLLSKDKEGKGKLSFLLFSPDGTPAEQFTEDDCFAQNNPDEVFVSNPVDIVHSGENLIMACQGDEAQGAAIYYLNEKTLVVENKITAPEFPDFKPTRMAIPSEGAVGVAYPILCENGNVYEFSTSEGALVKPKKLPYTYSQSFVTYDEGNAGIYYLLFWDKEANALCQVYRGYGPYFCSREYLLERDKFLEESKNDPNVNYFNGKKFARMDLIRMTPQQLAKNGSETLVMTSGGICQKVRLLTTFWTYNAEEASNVLVDNGGFSPLGFGALPVDEHTPAIANYTYKSYLYAQGNKVHRWNYTSTQLLKDAEVLLEVGSPTAVITNFEMSADHKITYVAFYEPTMEGNNGSVWAFDTDKGTVLHQYNQICYQPTKLIYKKK